MAAHSFVGDNMTKVPTEVTDAIRSGNPIPDTKLDALSKLTRSLTTTRGNVSQESHVLGIISGIAVKTMSNYSNHVANPKLDDEFSGRIWQKQNI